MSGTPYTHMINNEDVYNIVKQCSDYMQYPGEIKTMYYSEQDPACITVEFTEPHNTMHIEPFSVLRSFIPCINKTQLQICFMSYMYDRFGQEYLDDYKKSLLLAPEKELMELRNKPDVSKREIEALELKITAMSLTADRDINRIAAFSLNQKVQESEYGRLMVEMVHQLNNEAGTRKRTNEY